MAESEELKCLLMSVKKESEKTGFEFNIQKAKIMASGPTFNGKQKGEKWGKSDILSSWAPKSLQMVTVATKLKDTCSLEEKL